LIKQPIRPLFNIAHRGASGDFPENTLCAFDAAIAAGATMCELDVQRTADGVLVVIHDDTLERTTDGDGRVAATTFAALRRLDAGRWRSVQFAGERVPTLREVFERVRGRCALNVELKAPGTAAPVCELIHEMRAEETTLVSSFDWALLAEVRRLAPAITTGLLTDRAAGRALAAAQAMHATALNPRHDLIDRELCTAAHDQGFQVYAWTVDEPTEMDRLIDAGVDGIITDYPARLRALLEA
jgi:glycerophosphoryl diester phosphodiesterase